MHIVHMHNSSFTFKCVNTTAIYVSPCNSSVMWGVHYRAERNPLLLPNRPFTTSIAADETFQMLPCCSPEMHWHTRCPSPWVYVYNVWQQWTCLCGLCPSICSKCQTTFSCYSLSIVVELQPTYQPVQANDGTKKHGLKGREAVMVMFRMETVLIFGILSINVSLYPWKWSGSMNVQASACREQKLAMHHKDVVNCQSAKSAEDIYTYFHEYLSIGNRYIWGTLEV